MTAFLDNIELAINKITNLAFISMPLLLIIVAVAAICFLGYRIYIETKETDRLNNIYNEVLERKLNDYQRKQDKNQENN